LNIHIINPDRICHSKTACTTDTNCTELETILPLVSLNINSTEYFSNEFVLRNNIYSRSLRTFCSKICFEKINNITFQLYEKYE